MTCVDSGDKALQYLGLVDNKVDDEDNSEATGTYASSPSPNEVTVSRYSSVSYFLSLSVQIMFLGMVINWLPAPPSSKR